MGEINIISGTAYSGSGLIGSAGETYKNSYYLNGIEGSSGLTARSGEIVFYKTSANEEDMTTAKVVTALNNYIELKGVITEGDTEVDTTGWCKWVVGSNNLPALDFDTEWNGTAWVSTNN